MDNKIFHSRQYDERIFLQPSFLLENDYGEDGCKKVRSIKDSPVIRADKFEKRKRKVVCNKT